MSATPHDANSMDQVRELLFGAQLKEIEGRLQKQEDHIMQQLDALRVELRNAVSELEAGLSARLEQESRARGQSKSESDTQLANIKAELEKRAGALAEALSKSENALKKLISDENDRITASVEDQYKSALAELSNNTAQIREDMVDRSTISTLLGELAGKIAPAVPQKSGKRD